MLSSILDKIKLNKTVITIAPINFSSPYLINRQFWRVVRMEDVDMGVQMDVAPDAENAPTI
jgi:hypothetical protein